MPDKNIMESFERSAKIMGDDQTTFGSKLTNEASNDPATHADIHDRIQVDYGIIEGSPSMKEIHKWQREHIKKDEQSKEGYPLNVILDPAMRDMYK